MGIEPFIYHRPELDYVGGRLVDNSKLKSVIDWKLTISLEEDLKKVVEKLSKWRIVITRIMIDKLDFIESLNWNIVLEDNYNIKNYKNMNILKNFIIIKN